MIDISPMAGEIIVAMGKTDGTSVAVAHYTGRTTNSVAGLMKNLKAKGLIECTGEVIKTPEYPKGAFVHKVTGKRYAVKESLGRKRKTNNKTTKIPAQMYSCLDFYIYPKNYRSML